MDKGDFDLNNQYAGGLKGIGSRTGRIVAEYVWIDGTGIKMRSKCITLDKKVTCLEDIPDCGYDGSSCYQAQTENSEVHLMPVAYWTDPFRKGDNILVLCDGYVFADSNLDKLVPVNSNFRHHAKAIFD